MPNPSARRAMAVPMRPRPRMPSRLPLTRVASGNWALTQSPRRANRSAAEIPRATSIISPIARSATQSVSTSGVLLTAMPRCRDIDGFVADAEVRDDAQGRQGIQQPGIRAGTDRRRHADELTAVLGQKRRGIAFAPEKMRVEGLGER